MKTALAVILLMVLSACNSIQPPQAAYVKADRETFELIAPIILQLADGDPANDPDLTGTNSDALILKLESWKLRIEKAEEANR